MFYIVSNSNVNFVLHKSLKVYGDFGLNELYKLIRYE